MYWCSIGAANHSHNTRLPALAYQESRNELVYSRHYHGRIVVGIVGYHKAEEIAVFYLMESRSIAEILFPAVDLEDLQIFDASTQHHVKQIERLRERKWTANAAKQFHDAHCPRWKVCC